jgi:hypothetical protein
MDFMDLQGASGTVYRFRRWPASGAHPPIAGNYALLAAGTHRLVEVGLLDDLSQAPRLLADRLQRSSLFTRFNVARAHREADHADLVNGHPEVALAAEHAAEEVYSP